MPTWRQSHTHTHKSTWELVSVLRPIWTPGASTNWEEKGYNVRTCISLHVYITMARLKNRWGLPSSVEQCEIGKRGEC